MAATKFSKPIDNEIDTIKNVYMPAFSEQLGDMFNRIENFKESFNIPIYNSNSGAKTIGQFLSYMAQNNMRYLYLNGSSLISDWGSGLPVTSYIIAERLTVGAVAYLHMIGTVGNDPVAFVAFYINGITGIKQL